jgi:hypothetical protein
MGAALVFPDELSPPDIQQRPSTWTRPAEAILPDRWVVMLRRGNTRRLVSGNPIPEPLALTVDPNVSPAQQSKLPGGYTVDDKSRWTVDFDRAVQIGMGLAIPLSADEAQSGFDRVVVFGVKTSLAAGDTSVILEKLLDAHHYTRGLALVRQGSVTNNTRDRPTEYPPADDAGSHSFLVERQNPPLQRLHADPTLAPGEGEAVDGYLWSKLLGVPSGVAQNIERALEFEIVRASNMNRVLWPVTYGSFLKFLMAPVFSDAAILQAKGYFIGNVLARGPSPAFRVGAVPYGVLPVVSLRNWQPLPVGSPEDVAFETNLVGPLQRLFSLWESVSPGVARVVPPSPTPDLDLASVLSLYPSARDARLRIGVGPELAANMLRLLGWDYGLTLPILDQRTSDVFGLMTGHPEWRPRIGRTVFFPKTFLQTTPFVDLDENLSETAPLATDYLTGIAQAPAAALVANAVQRSPESLLYELLRISTLTEYGLQLSAALPQAQAVGQAPGFLTWNNQEVWGPLTISLPELQQESIISLLLANTPFLGSNPEGYAKFAAGGHLEALKELAGTPTAELDRLTRETLDLASHRVDAWVTALATRRVFDMRSANETVAAGPVGTFLGGYAWVEDLRPLARSMATAPDGTQVEVDPTNGGFVHCPGSRHAMAAAVLRSGFLSFGREDPQKYAFDLSSRQVRSGLQILDEVRAGRHLGEVLGYRFERGLQEDHPGVPGLNALRFTFRNMFPLVAGKNGTDTSQPADTVAAPNVVDGLLLYRAFAAGNIDFVGNPNLPHPGTGAYDAVIAELGNLARMLDGVSDLLVAEGVFQLAGGNVTGALPSLDNLVRGVHPPEPGIARSPRAGRGVSHAIVYVFQGPFPQPSPLPPSWPVVTPRGTAEPVLNAWLAGILGDPASVTATVQFTNLDGSTGSASVTLAGLQLQPLDLLALARAVPNPNQGSLLDARIVVAAVGDDPKAKVSIDYGTPSGTNRTFPQLMELLRTLGMALGRSRPLALDDLVSPADATSVLPSVEATALANAQELAARAQAARKALTDLNGGLPALLANLQPSDPNSVASLRAGLRAAAQFAPERAFVPSAVPATGLVPIANAVIADLGRRLDAASAAATAGGAGSAAQLATATAILQAIFGPDWFALPQVNPPTPQPFAQALAPAGQAALFGTDTFPVLRFLQQASHAREPLASARKLALYAQALGTPPPGASVVQLPVVAGEKWFALKLMGEVPGSRLSLVLLSQAPALDPHQPWAGIVLDRWTEVIPSLNQPTSVAFNYNGPRAEAPQAVLVIAPAQAAAGTLWEVDDIVTSLEQTMGLAKVRAVDRDLLGAVGQVIPGILIPTGTDDTITTSTGVFGTLASLPPFFSQGFQR